MPKDRTPPQRSKRRSGPSRVSFVRHRTASPASILKPARRRATATPNHHIRRSNQTCRQPRWSADYFGVEEDTLCHEQSDVEDEGDSDDDLGQYPFPWEDESTMFSDLIDDAPEESKDSKVENLVNRLQPAFDAHGRQLKREIAKTFVPTVNHVRILYHVLDDKVDISYGKGVLIFNNACKDLEAMAIKEQDELKDASALSKRNMDHLFGQLRAAYSRREQLWAEYEKAVDATVEPAMEKLKALPSKAERTIANLEKHARNLEKADNVTAGAMDIKGLLKKVS